MEKKKKASAGQLRDGNLRGTRKFQRNLRGFNTEGVRYKIGTVAIIALIALGIGVAAVVINHQPSEHANESVNASEHKSTKHEKPVGFGTKIVAFTSDKYKEKVDEKIAEKIAEKTDRAKIAIAIANATSVDQTEIKIGARVIAKINGSEINVTDVTP